MLRLLFPPAALIIKEVHSRLIQEPTDSFCFFVTFFLRLCSSVLATTRSCLTNSSVDRAARFLWGALQAHRVMSQYSSANFRDHTNISPILTRHLFAHRASAAQLKVLSTQLSSVDATAKQAKKAADSATALVNRMKAGRGGQGGGAQGSGQG